MSSAPLPSQTRYLPRRLYTKIAANSIAGSARLPESAKNHAVFRETPQPATSLIKLGGRQLSPSLCIRHTVRRHFLIDTGAEVSVFPAFSTDRIDTTGPTLVAANGTRIHAFGKRNLKFHIGRQPFSWDFLLADIPQPLLGADFLRAHALMVDTAGKRLWDTHKLSMTPLATTSVQPAYLQLSAAMTPSRFQAVLAEFPQLTQPNFSAAKPTHGVSHFIPTNGPPVHAKAPSPLEDGA